MHPFEHNTQDNLMDRQRCFRRGHRGALLGSFMTNVNAIIIVNFRVFFNYKSSSVLIINNLTLTF